MRKFIVVLALIFLSQTSYSQNKPEYGNWNIGGGLGYGLFELYDEYVLTNLNVEKHYNNYFSMNYNYSLLLEAEDRFPLRYINFVSAIPTLNLRSNSRFIFSLGARVTLGAFSFTILDTPIFGLNHQIKFRFLLGKNKVYRRDYRGEINIAFDPIYYRNLEEFFYGSFRMVSVNYIMPLSK